jgi:hypothetical protein
MSDFKTVLVRDSTIGDITSDIDFAVKSGASQTTYQRFPSTSSSNSALIFNVQVPSENVVIGRDILLSTGLTLTLTASGVTAGDYALNYGNQDAFQAFPLNSLLTTATVQINNTTVSINLQDVLPSLLRMNNSRELYRYNSMTPSLPDQAYGIYADANGANNNPLAGYANASYDIDQTPRGAFPLKIVSVVHNITAGGTDDSLVSTNVDDTWTIVVATVVTEPLFLSPFIFGEPEFNCQGLLGINNMSFTLNVDSTCKRVWSNGTGYIKTIALGQNGQNGFTAPAIGTYGASSQPALLFRFLSTQPSDLIQTKNIVPYMDFPRYLTNSANQPQIAGWDYTAVPQPAPSSATLTSSNLQINQIPDLFIINVRIPMSQQTIQNPSEFLTINNISINLNNQSGLLSSSSQYDLWRMSVKNGSTQSWAEFSGQAWKYDTAPTNTSSGYNIPTTGSLLIINPAYDLSLPDYISCGSLGNYNFQFQCNVTNQLQQAVYPEIIVITANSGIFTTQQGVSAVYTGILTKEMVLSAKSSDQASAMTSMEVKRMVGGNSSNMPLTAMKAMRMMKMMPRAGVSSGGVSSGGASSGGRLRKMC